MLDADARKVLDQIAAKNLPPYESLPVAAARAFFKTGGFSSQPPAPQHLLASDLVVPGPAGSIPLRHYRPGGEAGAQRLPALVFLHGGGFMLGDLDTHDTLCRELCVQAGIAVFSVDYRLGPEHKFPSAHEDCFAAVQWIAAHAETLAIDARRLAIGGDSAGGTLAAACAIMARDAGGPALALQLLIYPATDFSSSTPSRQRNAKGYLLTDSLIDYFCASFLPEGTDRGDWRVSPARAADLRGLAPALVLTAGYDPLVDEGRGYAERLRAAGNTVEYVCYEGQFHGFITMGRVLSQANHAVSLCAARLARL